MCNRNLNQLNIFCEYWLQSCFQKKKNTDCEVVITIVLLSYCKRVSRIFNKKKNKKTQKSEHFFGLNHHLGHQISIIFLSNETIIHHVKRVWRTYYKNPKKTESLNNKQYQQTCKHKQHKGKNKKDLIFTLSLQRKR